MKFLHRITVNQIFLFITAVYLIGYLSHAFYLHKTVYGDGIYYYAWLTSMNPSKFSIGPALFWFPLYSLTHNQIVVGLTGVLLSLFSLILLHRLLSEKFSHTVSIMTIAVLAGTTNLLFYGSLDTVNSHALSFFAVTVFLSLLLTKKKNWFAIGAALGIIGLMRAQDLLFGILLFPTLNKKNIVYIISGFLLAFFPQLWAWQRASGAFWLNPYLAGGREGFNFLRPHFFGVLFNMHNGLFLWTPITLLGLVGLFIKKRWLFTCIFLLELYTVASWSTWWQGASYSGRMFVSSLPVLAFGIADIFTWLTKNKFSVREFLLIFVIPLSFTNAVLLCSFLLFR